MQVRMHSRYYYPVGAPNQSATTIDGYRVSQCTYVCRFEKAVMIAC